MAFRFILSKKETRAWLAAFVVYALILSTLFLNQPLQSIIRDQNVQAGFFLLGMLLCGLTIIIHSLNEKASKTELAIWTGFMAILVMLFLRLGINERSHLIEYGVLAVFVFKALQHRFNKEKKALTAVLAFSLTTLAGVIDEAFQWVAPNRVFDIEDLVFNTLAAFATVIGITILQQARNKFRKSNFS